MLAKFNIPDFQTCVAVQHIDEKTSMENMMQAVELIIHKVNCAQQHIKKSLDNQPEE